MKWIGVTGGMGCVKSTVLIFFKDLGYGVVSADAIVHELYESPAVLKEISTKLSLAPEGLDKKNIASLVFNDAQKRKVLESVLHPKIREEVLKRKEQFKKQGLAVSFYEVPLLFENKMQSFFDCTLCVSVEKFVQMKRLKERNGWSDDEIESRLSAQMPLEEKKALADFVIDNSSSLEAVSYTHLTLPTIYSV